MEARITIRAGDALADGMVLHLRRVPLADDGGERVSDALGFVR